MHLTVGVTLYNVMPVETFMSFNNLLFELLTLTNKKLGKLGTFSFSFVNTKGLVTDQARNNIVSRFMQTKESNYLLFLDADMIFPPNLVERMLRTDADIITALAFKKWYPHYPTIYTYDGKDFKSILNYKKNAVFEIDGCGMACCLIKKRVFKKIKEPWFEFEVIKKPRFKQKFVLSEDLVFCKKVKKAGFKIVVDTSLICGHVGGVIDERTYEGIKTLAPTNFQTPLDLLGRRLGTKTRKRRKR